MTNLQQVLGIETPILLAAFGPWEQVDLAVAVCEAGQSAGLITDVVPAADIIQRIFTEASQALSSAYARLEQRGTAWP